MKDTSKIRQCEENCRSLFDFYGLARIKTVATLADRTLFYATPSFLVGLDYLTEMQEFERWDFVKNHGVTAFKGWRESRATCSMQIVLHTDLIIECDFDHFNPDYGLAPAIGHAVEYLWPGKTDPFAIMKRLRKRGVPVADVRKMEKV